MCAFTEHSIESAPPAARRFLTATRDHLGYLPAGMARMAASPQLIDGFKGSALALVRLRAGRIVGLKCPA